MILACNIILIAVKGLAGILGGSVALQAEAANSLGDVFAIILVYFGLLAASRPQDAEHPYGHGRVEDLVANLMGVALVLFGAYLLFSSILELVRGELCKPEIITMWAAAANVVAKEAMYRFARGRGEALRSPALAAVAADFRSDVLVSIGVLAGILGAVVRWPLLDPIVSIPVALMVVFMGVRLYRSSVHALMDGMPEEDILDRAAAVAESVPMVGKVHDIKGRLSGSSVLLDMKIGVDPGLTVDEGHNIARQVQDTILEEMREISSVNIHIDPLPHSHIDDNNRGPDSPRGST